MKLWSRTHLKTPPSRVRNDFLDSARRDEEAVAPALQQREATPRGEEIARTLRDAANFGDSFVASPRSIAEDAPSSSLRGLAEIDSHRGGRSFKMGSDVMRAVAAAIALYTLYIGHTGDALAVFTIIAGTFVFKLRRAIFIEPSRSADRWELSLTFLFAVNAVFVALALYNHPYLGLIDLPLHFTGGAVAGWWAYLVYTKNNQTADDPAYRTGRRGTALVFILAGAALLGFTWEAFEWVLDRTVMNWYALPKAQPSLDDTMKDLMLDVVGGLIAGIALLRPRKKL